MTDAATTLPSWRLRLADWLEQPALQRLLIGLILLNAIVLGLETSSSIMEAWGTWLVAADRTILAIFVVEIALRLLAHRLAFFRDPEGNRLEVFMDMPWYCEQPLREPIDLDQPDEAILARAEAIARSRPKFQSRVQWQAEMTRRMGYTEEA